MDPVTLTQLIAAVLQLAQMGVQGFKALVDAFPEFDQFWEEFEARLRDEEFISSEELDAERYRKSHFQTLVIAFMGADPEARKGLEEHFATFLEPAAIPKAMQAADEAAAESVSDERKVQLQSRRFILDEIKGATTHLEAKLAEVGEKVDAGIEVTHEVGEKVEEGVGHAKEAAAHAKKAAEDTARISDQISELKEGGLTPEQQQTLLEALEKVAEGTKESKPPSVNQKELEELVRRDNETLVQEVKTAVVTEIRELLEEILPGARPTDATSSAIGASRAQPLEEHVRKLRSDDPTSAARLDLLLEEGGVLRVVQALRAGEFDDGPLALLVAVARVVSTEGFYAEAEQTYLRAAELAASDEERAQQIVRAAGAAQVQEKEDRFREHLDAARALAPDLPGLAVAEARASRDSEYMLSRLEGVEGTNPNERALLHQTRAQAHLSLGNERLAQEELDLARAAAPENLAVREFEAILPWYSAQLKISRGERPERALLREAAGKFEELAGEISREGRVSETVRVQARAAEALMLAGETDRAQAMLEGARTTPSLAVEARLALARAALVCQRPDLVLRFVPENIVGSEARLVRADAQALGDDPEARLTAASVLEELLEDENEDIRAQAAFALLATAATSTEVAWNEEAAEIVRAAKPDAEISMRAERLYIEGKVEEAEATLLPQGGRITSLRRLRDYAMAAGAWGRAEDRSRALLIMDNDPVDRLLLAEALRHLDRRADASLEFLKVAHNASAPDDVRDSAYGGAMEIIGDARQYERIRELAEEWLEALPESSNARWNFAFSLARLSRHEEAYELLKDESLEHLNEQRGTLLAEILHRAVPPNEALRRLISLSDRFDRKLESVEALIIATSLKAEQEGKDLTDAIGDRIRDTYATFEERFPDSTAIRSFPAPTTPEEFRELMKETLGDRPQLQAEMIEGIASAHAAVNFLAVVANGGVGATWARLQALPLALATDETDAHEFDAARDTLGGAAVWDSSSLYVVGYLDGDLRPVIETALPGSLIATETLEDADSDVSSGGRGHSETLHDTEGNVWLREVPDEERDVEKRRIDYTLEFARSFAVEPGKGDGVTEELLELYGDDEDPAEMRALVATVALAQRTGKPVFSDDRWIREFARSQGVRAFGTVALLDALAARGLIDEQQRRANRALLARRGGWGVALDREELIAAGREIGFNLDRVLIGALHDRAAWRGRIVRNWYEVDAFLAAVYEEDPSRLGKWVRRALDAAATSIPHLPKSAHIELMLMMAWGLGEDAPQLSGECFLALMEEAKRLPVSYTTLGYDAVLGAINQYMSLLADESDNARFVFFWRLVRRLNFHDQIRAAKAFGLLE